MQIRKNIFLLDGVGAIITAISHGFILPYFHDLVGMPINILHVLAIVATCFAVYSISNYFSMPGNLGISLKLIAIANLCFCVATAVLMVIYREVIAPLGYLYFILEIIIVVILSFYELRLSKESLKKS